MAGTVRARKEGALGWIEFDHPERRNAISAEMWRQIPVAASDLDDDPEVRVVILRGSGDVAFAAGADISEFAGKNSDDVREFFGDNAWEAVWGLSKPTIAMVDGFALGGGTELALACDLRVASTRAKFGQPEINLGLIPGGGGTQRLCRLLGYGKAMEMTLTGEMVGADEALRIGLVNKVVEPGDLEGAALELAENIARKSPYTVKVAKRAVRAALDLPFTEGVLAERSEFVALFDTEDKEIGVSAFLERKDAEWVGR